MADNSADPSIVLSHTRGIFNDLTTYYAELTAQADPNDYNRLLVQIAYNRRLGELNNNLLAGTENFTEIRRDLEVALDKPDIETPDGIRLRQMTANFIERAAVIAENRGEYQALKNIADIVKQPGAQAFSEGMERSAEVLNKGQLFEKLNVPDYRREWFAKEILAPVLDQFAERQKAAQMEQAQAAWKIRPALLDDIEPRQRKIDLREVTPQEAEELTRQNHDQARDLYETSLVQGEKARRVDILLTILRDPVNAPLIGPGPEPAQAPVSVAPPTITIAPLPREPEAQPAPAYPAVETVGSGNVQSHDQQIDETPQTLPPQASSAEPDIDPHYNEQAVAVPNPADYKTILQELVNESQASGMPVRIGDVLDKFGAAHRDIYAPDIAQGTLSEILGMYGLGLDTSIDLNHENAPEAVKLLGRIAWIYDQHSGQLPEMVNALIQSRNSYEPHAVDEPIERAMKELSQGQGTLPNAGQQNEAANESPDTGGGSEDGLFTLDNAGRALLVIGAGAAAFYGVKKYNNRIPADEQERIAHDVKEELKQKHANRLRVWNELRHLRAEEDKIRLLPPAATPELAAERVKIQEQLAKNIEALKQENKKLAGELRDEINTLTKQKEAEYHAAAKVGKISAADTRIDPTFKRTAQDVDTPKALTNKLRVAYEQDLLDHNKAKEKIEADIKKLKTEMDKTPGDYESRVRQIYERKQALEEKGLKLEERGQKIANKEMQYGLRPYTAEYASSSHDPFAQEQLKIDQKRQKYIADLKLHDEQAKALTADSDKILNDPNANKKAEGETHKRAAKLDRWQENLVQQDAEIRKDEAALDKKRTALSGKEEHAKALRTEFDEARQNNTHTKSQEANVKSAESRFEAAKANAKLGDVNFKAAAGATTALAVLNLSQRFSDAGLKDLQNERSQVFAATGVGIDALGIGADIRAMQAVKQATDASKVITSSTASAEALAAANKTLAQATKASRWLGAPVAAAVGVAQGAVEYNIGMNTGDTKRAADGVLNAAGGTTGALAGAAAGAKAGAMAGVWFGPMGITICTIGGGLIGALTGAVVGGETAKWAGSDYAAAKLEKRLETLKEKANTAPVESSPKPNGSEVMVKNENSGKGLDNANAQSSFNKQAKRGIDFAEESFLMTSGLAPDPHNDMKIKT